MSVELRLTGVPPNWSNQRMHRMHEYQAKRDWKELVSLLGSGLRRAEGWPPARHGTQRKVTITLYRNRLLDHDGAQNSIKPLLDGLKRRGSDGLGAELIWEDNAGALLGGKAEVRQELAHGKERTVIEVEEVL